MADLTLNLPITEAWTEVTSALSLSSGSSYAVDVRDVDARAIVESVDTDDSSVAPSDSLQGHPVLPIGGGRTVDNRTYTVKSGAFLWVRTTVGTATLVVTEV